VPPSQQLDAKQARDNNTVDVEAKNKV
jgi:hypothetical protein